MDYSTGVQPVCLAMVDLNGDSRLDAVVANATFTRVSVLLMSCHYAASE